MIYSSVYQLADSWSHKPEVASSSLAAAPNSDAFACGVVVPSNAQLWFSSFSDCLSGLRAGSFFESSSQRLNETLVLLPKSSPGSLTRLFSELRRFAACVRPLINSMVGLKVSGSKPGHLALMVNPSNLPGHQPCRAFLGAKHERHRIQVSGCGPQTSPQLTRNSGQLLGSWFQIVLVPYVAIYCCASGGGVMTVGQWLFCSVIVAVLIGAFFYNSSPRRDKDYSDD